MSKEVAESLGLSRTQGALVRSVEANSPAEKAGVEAGDIILKFDGRNVEKSSDLPRIVGNTKPGSKSWVTVWRRGAQKELPIVVAEIEPEKVAVTQSQPAEITKPSVTQFFMGLTVGDLSDIQKKDLKLNNGVVVETVTDPAARAGIREGDVITAMSNSEVKDLKSFELITSKLDKSKPVNVLLRRGEWAQYVVIRPSR